MRLYLSSFMTGDCPQRLVSLAGAGTRAAVVLNALDNFPRQRAEWLGTQRQALESLGFVAHELDLRAYFGHVDPLAEALERVGLLWINGGNAFLLRRAMRQSGFDTLIRPLLARERLVYAGFSAAVCCAAPTLKGIDLVDDPGSVADGYTTEPVWDGLGLIDYSVAVHYRSDHSDAGPMEGVVRYYRQQHIPYVTLRDGEAIVVEGEKTEIVGLPDSTWQGRL